MPPRNRSNRRDVHIYDAKDRTTVLGGLILTNGVTNTNFYSMVEILFFFTSDFELCDEGSIKVKRDDDPLRPGRYYINAAGNVYIQLPYHSWLISFTSRSFLNQ
jgi:hypothetical protein